MYLSYIYFSPFHFINMSIVNVLNKKKVITKFEFLIGLFSRYRLFHPLVGITQNLQGRSIDLTSAYNEGCIQDMQHMRQTIDEEFHVS